jgi:hypothetical protein
MAANKGEEFQNLKDGFVFKYFTKANFGLTAKAR